LVLNAPAGYRQQLEPLPEGATYSETPGEGSFDFVQLFVQDSRELERMAPAALQAAGKEGALWLCYPKRSSGMETDLTRDAGWAVIYAAGLQGVRQIAVDETWSAVQFKPLPSGEALIDMQYEGAKAGLRPIYEALVSLARELGNDIALVLRKTYVGLDRGRQFAVIQPSTRTRMDLGLRLPGVEPDERLQASSNVGGGSITHKIVLHSPEEIDGTVREWLRRAYEQAG